MQGNINYKWNRDGRFQSSLRILEHHNQKILKGNVWMQPFEK